MPETVRELMISSPVPNALRITERVRDQGPRIYGTRLESEPCHDRIRGPEKLEIQEPFLLE